LPAKRDRSVFNRTEPRPIEPPFMPWLEVPAGLDPFANVRDGLLVFQLRSFVHVG